MSIKAINWAWEQDLEGPTYQILLIALADYADEQHSCWPSIEQLARKCKVSGKTISRHLKELIALGLVRTERRDNGFGSRASNRYFLAVDGLFTIEDVLEDNLSVSAETTEIPLGDNLSVSVTEPVDNLPALGDNCVRYIDPSLVKDINIFNVEKPQQTDSSGVAPPGGGEVPAERASKDKNLEDLNQKLGEVHPSLSIESISQKLKTVDIANVDVLFAVETILGRAEGQRIFSYPAFVAAMIERSPDSYAPKHNLAALQKKTSVPEAVRCNGDDIHAWETYEHDDGSQSSCCWVCGQRPFEIFEEAI